MVNVKGLNSVNSIVLTQPNSITDWIDWKWLMLNSVKSIVLTLPNLGTAITVIMGIQWTHFEKARLSWWVTLSPQFKGISRRIGKQIRTLYYLTLYYNWSNWIRSDYGKIRTTIVCPLKCFLPQCRSVPYPAHHFVKLLL